MNESNSEETIVVEALRLPPAERSAYLDQATGGNRTLRQRVESLLTSYQDGDFLEQSAAPVLQRMTAPAPPLTERAGDKIDRYKLLQQIGEGGCGVVYMAEQEEPVRRRVALKVIKLGMDTKSVIARFEAERQALAMMDHPNIAKVLDAGATDAGRPYFVMELVRGLKITEYCDEAKLSFRARLDLFMRVCHAIQHAHQKGIIHRDIKPSNILVTINDGVPVPKVIDFGIAKATGGQTLTDKTVFTAFEQFIGTPAYMSPEQAMLTSLDIDTRSDIYALGVLLYELLTGKTPFDAQELLSIGLDEMRRTIREKEPERPSTRLSTLPDKELSTTAQRRGIDAPRLMGQLRGDLDWIVMKCLEKDRARRYETATGLAADIERHVRNEPVVACPPGNLYRLGKLVRRNKLAFAAVSVVGLSLLVGMTASAAFFSREKAARVRADEQAAIAKAVTDFLQDDILRQAGVDNQLAEGLSMDTNLTVRQAVDRASQRLEGRFTNQPLVEASIQEILWDIYGGMGEPGTALRHAQRALELRQRILGSKDPLTLRSMWDVAIGWEDTGDFDKEVSVAKEGLQLAKIVLGPEDRETINWMQHLGAAYNGLGKSDKAVPLLEEALKVGIARLGPEDAGTLWGQILLGQAYNSAGRPGDTVPLLEKTLRLSKSKVGATNDLWRYSAGALAEAYLQTGRLNDAVLLMEEELKAPQDPDNTTSLSTRHNLASAYVEMGRPQQAILLLEPVLDIRRAKLGPDHRDTVCTMYELGVAYDESGQANKAVPLLEEALSHRKAQLGSDDPTTVDFMDQLGVAYLDSDQPNKAVPLLEEALAHRKAQPGLGHADTVTIRYHLGLAYLDSGQANTAVPLLEEGVAHRKAQLGVDDPRTLKAMDRLGVAYANSHQDNKAVPLLEEVLAHRKTQLGSDHADTVSTMFSLGVTCLKSGQVNKAAPLLEQAVAHFKAQLGSEDPQLRDSIIDLAEAYARQSKWSEAAADVSRLTDFNREYWWDRHFLAALLLQMGEMDRYRGLCTHWLTQGAGTKDPGLARAIAKDCLLSPSSGADLQEVAKLADFALSQTNDPDSTCWGQLSKGLSEYRLGRFAEAVPLLQLALSRPHPERDLQVQPVLAMSYWQLKQTASARTALASAAEIEARLPKLGGAADLGHEWFNLIAGNQLLGEARTLIEGSPPDKAKPQ
ncbi:MAG TPA: tetratricopeptide repeat protein [Verrucomicrobiae bacterium]|jgi:tetratricopeptide (TPR) repeat protein/tRNA A-37 threonylcarbamoyl transferase component Bud32